MTTSLSGSFTGVGVSPDLIVRAKESFSFSLAGTFVGTVVLERAGKGRSSWEPISSSSAAVSSTGVVDKLSRYRLRCSAYTSGTIDWTLAEGSDVIQQWLDHDGNVLFSITEAGVSFPTGVQSFLDSLFTLQDNLNTAKQMQFQLSGLTAGSTRTLTVPDESGTMVLASNNQTLSNKALVNCSVGTTNPLQGIFTSLTGNADFSLAGIESPVTAFAGGGQASAFALSATKAIHRLGTVATDGDSVKLPAATLGSIHIIINDGVRQAQVYGTGTDTINFVAAATGVSHGVGDIAIYACAVAGNWQQLRGIQSAVTKTRIINGYCKAGATAGWVVNAADNLGLVATLPESQTASTLVLPIPGLKTGDIITGFFLSGQIESAGAAVTLDADLRKLTAQPADVVDTSVGAITQLSVTADTSVSAANTTKMGLNEMVAADETFYLLITGTTAALTDIALQGAGIIVSEVQ